MQRRTVTLLVTLSALGLGVGALWLRSRQGDGDALDQFAHALQLKPEGPPRNQWRSIAGKHWQAIATETPAAINPDVGRGVCQPGMVEVRGKMRLDTLGGQSSEEVEALQNRTCINWINRDFPARCAEFSREAWLPVMQALPVKETRYCMDRFEYPNAYGENPVIVVTYTEAAKMCSTSGKRLCSESEWTFACEGEEATPYPNGYVRDPEGCVVDQPWHAFTEGALFPRDGENARVELDRLWQGRPSGSRAACKSAFGIYDLTGNVDEWTSSVRSTGYASILKGGYWGPVRARCRASTRAHDEGFVAYQQGFRCCADVPKDAPAAAAAQPSEPVDAGGASAVEASDAGTAEELDASTSAPSVPAPKAQPSSLLGSAQRLVEEGIDAGALAPEFPTSDENDVLTRKRAPWIRPGCSYAGTSTWWWSALGAVVLMRRRTRRV